jgi:hypothetical protein
MKQFLAIALLLASTVASAQEKRLTSLCGFDFEQRAPDDLFHEPTVVKKLGKGLVSDPGAALPTHEYRLGKAGYLKLTFIENDTWLVNVLVSVSSSAKDVPVIDRNCKTKEGLRLGDAEAKALSLYGPGTRDDSGVLYRYDDIDAEAHVKLKNGKVVAIEMNSLVP